MPPENSFWESKEYKLLKETSDKKKTQETNYGLNIK